MTRLFITRENLMTLVERLKNSCDEFIAPKREHSDDIVFGDAKDDKSELLDYDGNSVISPRAFLLPQTETLFKITSAKDCNFSPVNDTKKRIFYGVRPCDIKALKLMRSFFLGDLADIPYKEKTENSIFIALACNSRCSPESFCHEIGSGPIAAEGFDLQLIPVKRGYIV